MGRRLTAPASDAPSELLVCLSGRRMPNDSRRSTEQQSTDGPSVRRTVSAACLSFRKPDARQVTAVDRAAEH